MTTRNHSFSRCLLSIVASLWLAACGIQIERVDDEPRRGPGGSFFVGGLDGGVFVKLAAKDAQQGIYTGALYEENGQLIYRGELIHNNPQARFDPASQESYDLWSGERLYLRNNTYLTPHQPVASP